MQRERRVVRVAAAAFAVVLGLAACEGDNLFRVADPVTEGPPEVTQLLVPPTAFVGDIIPVTVTAVARRGIQRVLITYRGVLDTDQDIGQELGTDSVRVETSVQVPVLETSDSLLVVTARARDVNNRISAPVTDTVIVRQLPVTQAGDLR